MPELPWFRNEEELLSGLRNEDFVQGRPVVPGCDQVEEVERGGQGIVYRARQIATHRIVAIKVLYEGVVNVVERRIRFEREVELVASLQHPSIVRIYDGGVLSDGRLYTVMEYVDGVPLDKFVEDNELTTEQVVELFTGVCDAVVYAHRKGIIHRDLKPNNILVSQDGVPHVLDFGIARTVHSETTITTQPGQFVGTLAYASPEQVSAEAVDIDIRTDVYSLGVVLYRLLAGKGPYPTDRPIADVVRSICIDYPPIPSQIGKLGDRDLDAIVLRALRKDPDDRYSTVDAMSKDLRRYRHGEVLEARGDSSWYVFRKTMRRHRFKVATAIATFTVLLLFSTIVTGLWRRAVVEEQKTREIKIFWEDTLGSVVASQPGTPITFKEVLDEAVHWAAITTGDQPEIEASLRNTIGNGYRNLQLFAQADIQLERSAQIRQQIFGTRHHEFLQSLNAIALLRQSEGKYEKAEEGFREVMKAREQTLGNNHPDVAMSLQNLGRLVMQQGRLTEAEKYFERALRIRQRHFTENDPAIATVLFNLGDLRIQQQRWAEAQQLHRSALEMRQLRLSATHPDLARSLLALCRVLLQTEPPVSTELREEARAHAQQALDLRSRTLDTKHMLVQEAQILVNSFDE